MDECRGLNLWQDMNDIRNEFVPPHELKNILNEIKRLTQELKQIKKQGAKLGEEFLLLVDDLLAKVESHRVAINNAAGRDQRDAMQEFWDGQYWQEKDALRARIELPREMKNIIRDLNIVKKNVKAKAYIQAYKYFGVDIELLQKALDNRQEVVNQINNYVKEGNIEEAYDLLRDEIYEGWHPGDVRHFSDMLREFYQRMKPLKDTEIKEQIMAIMASIVETFNSGDYRYAKDTLIQFSDQMRKYEPIFRRYYGGREMDDKTLGTLEKLETLIQEKLSAGGEGAPKEELKSKEENRIMPLPPNNEPG